jgi:hypothetical protein
MDKQSRIGKTDVVDDIMNGSKNYLQPKRFVLTTVYDIAELLQGRTTFCDTPNVIIRAQIKMYGKKWDVLFAVKDIGNNRSRVTIGIDGKMFDKKKEIRSMFTLLDSMLLLDPDIEFEESGAFNMSE